MFRIDQPTATQTLPTPAAPGTPGFFTNGNLALGVPSTVVDADFLNRLQEEDMSVLTAAGISPIKTNFTQLLAAIRACSVLTDVSASVNVLAANPAPALTTIPVINTQFVIIPAITNTGAASLNISSTGAVNVLRPDGTVLQPGDLPANRRIPIIFDGSAWRLLAFPGRVRLGANLTLFCNAQTGNDANNGLTLATAFQSFQGVWNYLYQNVDVTGYVVTVQCSGNFSVGLNAQTVVVGATPASIVFNLQAGSTVNVTNSSCFFAQNPGVGFTVTGPGLLSASGTATGQGCAFFANVGAQIWFAGVNFGVCATAHVLAQISATIQATGNYTISGNAPYHLSSSACSSLLVSFVTVTLTGTPAFATAYAYTAVAGIIWAISDTFTGSATGSRYSANTNGVIYTNGGGASYFPGGAVGTTATGGQYA
jgi:hypothetical protein